MPVVNGTYQQSPPQITITVTDGGGGDRIQNTHILIGYNPAKVRYLGRVKPKPTKHTPTKGACIWLSQTIGSGKEFKLGLVSRGNGDSKVHVLAIKITSLGVSRGSKVIKIPG